MSPSRVREKVVTAKAGLVREMLAAIETLPLASLETFLADRRMVAAGESFLRRALEALLDLGRHLLAKGFAIAVVEYKEIPRALAQRGVLDEALGELLTRMAGYRNRMVHFYDEVTPAELFTILTHHRADVAAVLGAIETWLAKHPDLLDDAL